MHAMKVAPGMRRHFAAERWGIVPEERWTEIRKEAHAGIYRDSRFRGYGSDLDAEAAALSLENAKKAGVDSGCGFARPI